MCVGSKLEISHVHGCLYRSPSHVISECTRARDGSAILSLLPRADTPRVRLGLGLSLYSSTRARGGSKLETSVRTRKACMLVLYKGGMRIMGGFVLDEEDLHVRFWYLFTFTSFFDRRNIISNEITIETVKVYLTR